MNALLAGLRGAGMRFPSGLLWMGVLLALAPAAPLLREQGRPPDARSDDLELFCAGKQAQAGNGRKALRRQKRPWRRTSACGARRTRILSRSCPLPGRALAPSCSTRAALKAKRLQRLARSASVYTSEDTRPLPQKKGVRRSLQKNSSSVLWPPWPQCGRGAAEPCPGRGGVL